MKKILSLLLALCLLCLSAAALAEKAQAAQNTVLELDGFTLHLTEGEAYEQSAKRVNQVYVTVYPGVAEGDEGSNYNFVWAGAPLKFTTDDINKLLEDFESQAREQFASMGVSLDSFSKSEPYEATLNEIHCVGIDMTLTVSAGDISVDIYERQLLLDGFEYIITLSAQTSEALDVITNKLANALTI